MQRWTAKFLLLVMLVPAFVPLALARAPQPMSPHCARQMAKPAMPCHGMAMPQEQSSSDQAPRDGTSLRASEDCCASHDCCRGLKTSEWARPASNLLSSIALLVEHARATQPNAFASSDVSRLDSARAPPLA